MMKWAHCCVVVVDAGVVVGIRRIFSGIFQFQWNEITFHKGLWKSTDENESRLQGFENPAVQELMIGLSLQGGKSCCSRVDD